MAVEVVMNETGAKLGPTHREVEGIPSTARSRGENFESLRSLFVAIQYIKSVLGPNSSVTELNKSFEELKSPSRVIHFKRQFLALSLRKIARYCSGMA